MFTFHKYFRLRNVNNTHSESQSGNTIHLFLKHSVGQISPSPGPTASCQIDKRSISVNN